MRASSFWLLAGLLTTTASCSLAGLDHFRVGSCAGDCAQLNARDHLDPNSCHAWQCDATGEFCELPRVPDRDHDGHAPIACGGTDCDDHDRDSVQGAAESCDGIDNDCNGLVDDVMGAATAPMPIPVLSGAASPAFVSYAGTDDGVVIAWRSGSTPRVALVDQLDAQSVGRDLSATATAMTEQALASATPATGCPQITPTSLSPPLCDASHACTGGLVCVTTTGGAEICELPVVHNVPPHAMECATHAECQDGLACNGREVCDPTSAAGMLDPRGCRPATSTMPCATAAACDELHDQCIVSGVGACTFADLALAPVAADEWMTLGVTTDGCAAGRVRTGVVDATSSMPSLLLWGDHRLSTTWAGVDLDDVGCTGASRAASDPVGGAGVAVAGLAFDPLHGRPIPQALAAWRAAPVCSGLGTCTSTPPASAAIELLGLWRERGDAGGTAIRWVDGSDDGRPVRLPDAAASPRASVTSWELGSAAGYTVAYARAGGGVALAFVHAFTTTAATALAPECAAPVPPVCLAAEAGPDRVVGSMDDGESLTRVAMPGSSRTTPSLGAPIPESILATDTVIGDVAIAAAAPASATDVRLALAFATATEVVLARVTFDPATDMMDEEATLRFASAGARDVSVVHLDAGLVEAGATARPLGGVVVAWSTTEGTYAVRIADDGGEPIAPGVVRLGAATDHPRAFVDTTPGMGGEPATHRAHVVAHQADGFVAFPTICGSAS